MTTQTQASSEPSQAPPYPLQITNREIASFVGIADAEDKLERYIRNKHEQLYPEPTSPDAERDLDGAIAAARRRLNQLIKRRDRTDTHVVHEARDPDYAPHILDMAMGVSGVLVMISALLVMPGMATMLIVEANKIALVADNSAWGLLFGIAALIGVFASIMLREHIETDTGKRRFDHLLIAASLLAAVLWSVIASTSAFPIEINSALPNPSAALDDWGDTAVAPTDVIVLRPPTAVFFIVTTLLELMGGAVLHRFALMRIRPRTVKHIVTEAEHEALERELIPEATASLEALTEAKRQATAQDRQWQAARAANIERARSAYRLKNAEYKLAQQVAALRALQSGNAGGPEL